MEQCYLLGTMFTLFSINKPKPTKPSYNVVNYVK